MAPSAAAEGVHSQEGGVHSHAAAVGTHAEVAAQNVVEGSQSTLLEAHRRAVVGSLGVAVHSHATAAGHLEVDVHTGRLVSS